MQPRNRLTEFLAEEPSQADALFDAMRQLDPRREVERHVVRVRSSVALLLRSLGDLQKDEDALDEQAVVESCLSCADALEDLLVFLFPRNKAEDRADDEGEAA